MESIRLSDKELVLTADEFCLFRELIRKEFGILLKVDGRLTFHTKVAHRVNILGFSSYKEYYDYIISDQTKREVFNLVSHLTNNETYFMRERSQIEVFIGLLKEMKNRKIKCGQREIRILSAGCSTGEEVYSINISLIESGLFSWGWDVRIIGIDVNGMAIKRARNATYSRNSFRAFNGSDDFVKYFHIKDDKYILKGSYKKNVEFIEGNILDERIFQEIGRQDAIFCRNVMIYMSDDAIQKVTRNFYHTLLDEGYLFIGSSESLVQKTDLFIPELRDGIIVYRKNIFLN